MNPPAPTATAILEAIQKQEYPVLTLLNICRQTEYDSVWKQGPEVHRAFAKLLIDQGYPTLALQVANLGIIKREYTDAALEYHRALALARCGNPSQAGEFIDKLLKWPVLPAKIRSDAVSLSGRVNKDLATRATEPHRTEFFRRAYEAYQKAFDESDSYFPGINAASLALLSGQEEKSKSLAERVRDLALQAEERIKKKLQEDDAAGDLRELRGELSWVHATLGEAYVLLGDKSAANGRYKQAVQFAREERLDGNIASMRKQLVLLAEKLPFVKELLSLFHLGPVVVFAGHGIDRPDETFRFPNDPKLELAVRQAIKEHLEALDANIGYCSPGAGSDILFGELIRERSGELHMVLPFKEDDFLYECVDFGLAELDAWRNRFHEMKGFLRIECHFATTEPYLKDQVLYDFCGTFMQGLGLIHAERAGVEAIALVVYDPASPPNSGLSTFLTNWKNAGRELRVIELPKLREKVKAQSVQLPTMPERKVEKTPPRSLKAMLFADVAGFSGVDEEYLPKFFVSFLQIVAEEINVTKPLCKNTWGDGLYLVFEDVVTCADFALRLLKRMAKFAFEKHGFKMVEEKRPGIRIGLHHGPVFEIEKDPIIEARNFYGSHVSRAARIEPITVVGDAFTSEQFASALTLAPNHNFICDYLGLQRLAKGYDETCPLYRLTERWIKPTVQKADG